MAEDVNVKIGVDAGQARAEIQKVKNDVEDLKGTTKKQGNTMKEFKTASEGLAEGVRKIGASTGRAGEVGVLAFNSIKDAIKGAKTGTQAFKAALVSIGIGAAMLALDVIIDNWKQIEAFITGSTKSLKAYESAQQGVKDVTRQADLANASLASNMNKLKRELDDQSLSLDDRINKLGEIANGQKNMLDNELAILDAEQKSIDAAAKAGEFTDEHADREFQIAMRRKAIAEEKLQIDHDLIKQGDALIKQAEAEAQAAKDKAKAEQDIADAKQRQDELEKERRLQAGLDAARQAELDAENLLLEELGKLQDQQTERTLTEEEREIRAVEEKYFELRELAIRFGEDTILIEEERQNALDKITEKHEKIRTDMKKKESKMKVQLEQQIMNDIIAIVGQETAAGKAMSVALATINSYVAFTSALSNPAKLPPPLPQLQAVAALTSGLAQVKRIVATKIPNQFGAAGMSMGGMTSTTPSVGVIGANLTNEAIQQGFGQISGKQPVLKTYVTSGDVTTAQALDRRIERNASFG